MKQVLVYSDSLSWGIIPGTRDRLRFDERWTGVLENAVCHSGQRIRIIEDCLNGRRTIWEDPFKAGRNGLQGLAQRIEIHSPLSLVILMLGTNDFQFCHPNNDAWAASQGIAILIDAIRTAPIEPGMPVPPILIVSPPLIRQPRGPIAAKFRGAEDRGVGLAAQYKDVAAHKHCLYFDAETVTSSSVVDGVHLDRDQHQKLGEALADVVTRVLQDATE